jgi:ATP-dependent DNA helicase RecG
VAALPGIGPARSKALDRLGIRTLRDALLCAPRRYEDRRTLVRLGRLRPGQTACVAGRVKAVGTGRTRRGIPYCEVLLEDGTGSLAVRWYRQPYLSRTFRRGMGVLLAGRVSPYPPREMINPEYELQEQGDAGTHAGRIVPIYALTAGMTQRFLRGWLADLSRRWAALLSDPLPPDVRARHALLDLPTAARALHLPDDMAEAESARRRLAFDDFFLFSLMVLRVREARAGQRGIAFTTSGSHVEHALHAVPFLLTPGQTRALGAIWDDMARDRPMYRLLQGDVGSGKTMVALLACLTAAGSGYQAAIMAPTEILAAQHAARAGELAAAVGIPVVHLAGSLGAGARRDALAALASQRPCLAVGTHALLQPDVAFGRLGFVVVDEQHRFGVLQRAALQAKGACPDVLVMSATPIPRSLALILYGDLDLSVIDDLPPGRQPVTTSWVEEADRPKVEAELLARLARGERIYVVCPAVDDSPAELTAAVRTAESYRRGPLRRFGVGLVHGRLRSAEKLEVVEAFRQGRVQVLVATTVVEVGMDVPEAMAIVVEDADRLGLAQLHQLRGRVGRSRGAGHCFLVADRRTVSEEARQRLEALVREHDGFALAEVDLRLRGPGEFFGTRQAGTDGFPLGSLAADLRLLEEARHEAQAVLRTAPALDGAFAAVRQAMESRSADRLGLAHVG